MGEYMRDLATVCTVDKAWDLPGKNKVHGISMVENGYEAMVGKDIQPGSLVVFIQEGALLPAEFDAEHNPIGTWAFLMALKCYKENLNKYLIKVKKFKEIRSWGLVLRLDQIGLDEKTISKLKAGDDITDLLKIEKYEEEEEASPKKQSGWIHFLMSHPTTRWIGRLFLKNTSAKKCGFPSEIISKSDETTIQNCKIMLERFAKSEGYTSCKMEGQSGTYLFDMKGKKPTYFYVCSRNLAYKAKCENDYWKIAQKYDLKNKIYNYWKKTGKLLVIQGEQVGPGIQENIYGFEDLQLFVYKIVDAITRKQLPFDEMMSVCAELELPTVPIIERGIIGDIMPSIDDAVVYAEQKYWKKNEDGTIDYNYIPKKGEKLWKDYCQHEGVVVRTTNFDKENGIGCSFKVKNCEYAEKGLSFIKKVFG